MKEIGQTSSATLAPKQLAGEPVSKLRWRDGRGVHVALHKARTPATHFPAAAAAT